VFVISLQRHRWLVGGVLSLFFLAGAQLTWGFAGEEGASFLDVPVGAGPAALGSAYTPLANNAYAPVWNPAGLGFLSSTQVAAMHQAYLQDTAFEFLSVVRPLGENAGIGFSAQYFRPGDIDGTDINGNPIGTVTGHYGAYSLAFGRRITEALSFGLTGKIIEAKIQPFSATAYGADAGLFYRATKKLTLAAVVANVGSKLKFINEADPLPLAFRGGASLQMTDEVRATAEGVLPKYGQPSFHFGVEWPSEDRRGFCVRTGYSTDRTRETSSLAGLTVGLGIPFWNHELSYAWMPLGSLGQSHYFSMVLRFGEPEHRNVLEDSNPDGYWLMQDMNNE
jgi:hypothetical protein